MQEFWAKERTELKSQFIRLKTQGLKKQRAFYVMEFNSCPEKYLCENGWETSIDNILIFFDISEIHEWFALNLDKIQPLTIIDFHTNTGVYEIGKYKYSATAIWEFDPKYSILRNDRSLKELAYSIGPEQLYSHPFKVTFKKKTSKEKGIFIERNDEIMKRIITWGNVWFFQNKDDILKLQLSGCIPNKIVNVITNEIIK